MTGLRVAGRARRGLVATVIAGGAVLGASGCGTAFGLSAGAAPAPLRVSATAAVASASVPGVPGAASGPGSAGGGGSTAAAGPVSRAGNQPAVVRPPGGGSASTVPVAPPGSSAKPLNGVTIGVDPGHNGGNFTHPSEIDQQIWNGREWENCNTTGTSTNGGYTEALFNFRVATFLQSDLAAAGAHVVMTRTSDTGVGPCVNKRAAIINDAHASVGIEIHADGAPAGDRGFAILEPVADGPNDQVISSSARFGLDLRSALLAGTAMPVSDYDGVNGIKPRDDLAGLNLIAVPTVLVEVGNMRNATDAGLETSATFQQAVARAIESAMVKFLG
ncbi:MAG TPA: N-acetylmuramoyl-L-alanine amidase [Trebonia sp.]|jgi:N-acetylmuramoyl-L-alanine amidase|nr:N-acetylmuramoyl-L-alanine amidase [Trebonia sp.]